MIEKRTARNETDINQLTAPLVEVVQETLQPQQITLWLKENLLIEGIEVHAGINGEHLVS